VLLGSPSGSLEHRCLFYCHWLIRGSQVLR
jgi:hypothetical protein